jgi:hypothetical protein
LWWNLFCQYRCSKMPLCLTATYWQGDYAGRITKIVDTWLTLIFKIWWGACRDNFALQRQPLPRLYLTTTEAIWNYQTYII